MDSVRDVQMLGYQQIVSMVALRDAAIDIRGMIRTEAKRRMAELAARDGYALIGDGPEEAEQPLVWVENWSKDGGDFVIPEMARAAGVDAEPTVLQLRYRWRTLPSRA